MTKTTQHLAQIRLENAMAVQGELVFGGYDGDCPLIAPLVLSCDSVSTVLYE
jgi:hypothetical protein